MNAKRTMRRRTMNPFVFQSHFEFILIFIFCRSVVCNCFFVCRQPSELPNQLSKMHWETTFFSFVFVRWSHHMFLHSICVKIQFEKKILSRRNNMKLTFVNGANSNRVIIGYVCVCVNTFTSMEKVQGLWLVARAITFTEYLYWRYSMHIRLLLSKLKKERKKEKSMVNGKQRYFMTLQTIR